MFSFPGDGISSFPHTRYPFTKVHGVTEPNTVVPILAAVRTSNLTHFLPTVTQIWRRQCLVYPHSSLIKNSFTDTGRVCHEMQALSV